VDFSVHLREKYQPMQLQLGGRRSSTTLRREPSSGPPLLAAAAIDMQGCFVVFEVQDAGVGMDAGELLWDSSFEPSL
jgi:hypothetical protein